MYETTYQTFSPFSSAENHLMRELLHNLLPQQENLMEVEHLIAWLLQPLQFWKQQQTQISQNTQVLQAHHTISFIPFQIYKYNFQLLYASLNFQLKMH